ncbi:MAG: helix-turn-helix transcriptional regulator, partial [Pseudomonadota bacterium]
LEVHAFNVSGLLHEAIVRVCQLHQLDNRIEADQLLYELFIHELKTAETHDYDLVLPKDVRARTLAERMLKSRENLQDALNSSGLNRRTAERLFSAQTGMSPAQWLRTARLSQSVISLVNGESIDEVALETGYKSRSAFSHAFKRKFGFSPGMTNTLV